MFYLKLQYSQIRVQIGNNTIDTGKNISIKKKPELYLPSEWTGRTTNALQDWSVLLPETAETITGPVAFI